jgi:hypothetical protein
MSFKPKLYRHKPLRVLAVQWLENNAAVVKQFVGFREDNGECRFLLPQEVTGVWELPHLWDELDKN